MRGVGVIMERVKEAPSMPDVLSAMALRLVEGVGDTLFRRMLDEFEDAEAAFASPERALMDIERMPEKTARAVRASRDDAMRRAERALALTAKAGAQAIPCFDPRYPPLLKDIHDYPAFLFVKGDPEALSAERAVAVVGTRRATAYGKKMTHDLARDLAARGACIVSGLAHGVDAAAHRAALEAEGGRTVAVLGCGIDQMYPPDHGELAEAIARSGAVVTEFFPQTPPDTANFPKRNRIIAGLSRGVLVVEAPPKSGALITAKWAEEYGRPVCAVPGPSTAVPSQGTNALLKRRRAAFVETWQDVALAVPALHFAASEGETSGGAAAVKVEFASPEEKEIFSHLSVSDPVHIDSLAMKTGLSISTLLTHLLAMEIRDLIAQVPGKLFLRRV